jgi:hypothetical protein
MRAVWAGCSAVSVVLETPYYRVMPNAPENLGPFYIYMPLLEIRNLQHHLH